MGAGDQDDWNCRVEPSDLDGEVAPVHSRHHHVGYDHIDGVVFQDPKGVEPVCGIVDRPAFSLERTDHYGAHYGIVVHDENGG